MDRDTVIREVLTEFSHKSEEEQAAILFHAYSPQGEYVEFSSLIVSPDARFSEFVRLNFLKYRTANELANAYGMKRQKFMYKFIRVFGTTPHKWIRDKKAQLICNDICSGLSFRCISDKYEFPNISNFFRFCREVLGESPSAMRDRYLSTVATDGNVSVMSPDMETVTSVNYIIK